MASYGIQQTEDITRYLRKLMAVELGGGEPIKLSDLSIDFLEELHFTVKLVKQAILNKSK